MSRNTPAAGWSEGKGERKPSRGAEWFPFSRRMEQLLLRSSGIVVAPSRNQPISQSGRKSRSILERLLEKGPRRMSGFSPSSETELASQMRRDITNRREALASHHKSALLVLPLLLLLSASTAAADSLTDAAVAFTSQDPQCFSGSTGSIGRIESGPCLILRSLLRDALCRQRWSSNAVYPHVVK